MLKKSGRILAALLAMMMTLSAVGTVGADPFDEPVYVEDGKIYYQNGSTSVTSIEGIAVDVSDSDYDIALEVYSDDKDTKLTVKNDVSITQELTDDYDNDGITAVVVNSDEGQESDVIIEKNVSAVSTAKSGDDDDHYYSNAESTAIRTNVDEAGTSSVLVKGNASATAAATDNDDENLVYETSAKATVVDINEYDGNAKNKSKVEIQGSSKAEATAVASDYDGDADARAYGVNIETYDKRSSVDVQLNDLTVTATASSTYEASAKAYGIYNEDYYNTANQDIHIAGNLIVEATAKGEEEEEEFGGKREVILLGSYGHGYGPGYGSGSNASAQATGIKVFSNEGAKTNVTVDKQVKAIANGDSVDAIAIYGDANGEDSEMNIDVGTGVEGQVLVKAEDGGHTILTVEDGGVKTTDLSKNTMYFQSNPAAVVAKNEDGTMDVSIAGGIESDATGVISKTNVSQQGYMPYGYPTVPYYSEGPRDIQIFDGMRTQPSIRLLQASELDQELIMFIGKLPPTGTSTSINLVPAGLIADRVPVSGGWFPVLGEDMEEEIATTNLVIGDGITVGAVDRSASGAEIYAGKNALVISEITGDINVSVEETEKKESDGLINALPIKGKISDMGSIRPSTPGCFVFSLDATGVLLDAENGAEIDSTGNGNIVVENESEEGKATGFDIENDASVVNASHTGNITVTGAQSSGVLIDASADYCLVGDEKSIDHEKAFENDIGWSGCEYIKIQGEIVRAYYVEQENGEKQYYVRELINEDRQGFFPINVKKEYINSSTTTLSVKGNVTAEGYGVELHVDENSKVDVAIDGTLAGGDAALVLMGDGKLNDNVTVTVWKLEGKAYHMADTEENEIDRVRELPMYIEKPQLLQSNGDDQNNEAPDGMEEFSPDEYKVIRYIVHIKDDEDSKNLQVVSGIQNDGTNDYACKDDKIVVKLNIPEGKELVGAYWNEENATLGYDESDGSYYVIMPHGGGVLLSMALKDKDPEPQTEPQNESQNETQPETPKTDPETPKTDLETPKADTEAPKADAETPKADSEAPKADSEVPETESESQNGETTKPNPGSKPVTESTEGSEQENPKQTVTVRIDPDGGIVKGRKDSAPYSMSIVPGATITLKDFDQMKKGCVLLGWYKSKVGRGENGWVEPDPENDADKFLQPGDSIVVDEAMVLTAIWAEEK